MSLGLGVMFKLVPGILVGTNVYKIFELLFFANDPTEMLHFKLNEFISRFIFAGNEPS